MRGHALVKTDQWRIYTGDCEGPFTRFKGTQVDGTGRESLIIIKISQKYSSKETIEDNIFFLWCLSFFKKIR